MKRTIILLIFMAVCLFTGCKNEANINSESLLVSKEEVPEKSTANLEGKIAINLEKSVVKWKGSMLFSFGNHFGTVDFKAGSLEFENNEIKDGSFVVDMTTIVNTDGDYSEDLVNHLKNEDFFDVEKFPESKLEFIGFEKVNDNRLKIDANLTVKDVTKPVTLYNVDYFPEERRLSTKFKIDRTEFGINYNSKGFAKVKDYAISDAVELEVEVYFDN
ncbi:YceI family protein [Winogradskyella marincola]|uniref:YceI family protein n=1 Tax=Winogradskyella marincola TaxID=3037795 RepID=A0ABT6G075_9FLAO|nr:YceI family protein [Winogradskyella sp. YYF002]MDG4715447.1 YceI family protein [Winogradskyella sp. YYF002]